MERAIALGFEGIMIKTLNGSYFCKRSYEWQKMKPFLSDEFEIIDFEEGEGRNERTLGKVIVSVDGVRVGVGSSFSDDERRDIWSHKEAYLGRLIEVQFQELIKETGSLRFPTVKGFRFDKE